MSTIWKTVGLLLIPSLLVGQEVPDPMRLRVDTLLDTPEVDSLLQSMEARFVGHFLMLVPDLPAEEREILEGAARDGFDPSSLRATVGDVITTDADQRDVTAMLEMQTSGSQAELRRVTDGFDPEGPLDVFVADVAGLDRERLQLMVALTEAQGAAERDLLVDEALRRVAHQLVAAVGGAPGDFEPLSDEVYDAAYRERTLSRALVALHRLQPASDSLVEAVVDEYRGGEAGRYREAYLSGLLAAVSEAGARIASLTVAQDEPDAQAVEEVGGPCHVQACGFVVQWDGREPTGNSLAYGVPGDVERLVLANLMSAGFSLVLGAVDDGPTIRLRPRTSSAYCEIMTGTVNRVCLAVGQVRVEFLGSWDPSERPGGFNVVNRCGANSIMGAEGISALVAARIAYALTTFPGDDREVPRC